MNNNQKLYFHIDSGTPNGSNICVNEDKINGLMN